MRNRFACSLVLLLSVTAWARQSAGQGESIPPPSINLELGYRFVNVSGNEGMYRTILDEREGLLLRAFTFDAGPGTSGGALFDQVHLTASDFGAGPDGSLRLDAEKSGLYRLHFNYLRLEDYSALPAFANPLLDSGIVPGQQTENRLRSLFNADLELLPGAAVVPVVGYSRNEFSGPGRTTITVGQNEFLLNSNLKQTEDEVRVGARVQADGWSGEFLQGWRRFAGNESLELASGANSGNNTGTVLGQPVVLTNFQGSLGDRANTPETNAFLNGAILPQLHFTGFYARARASGENNGDESLSGSLVSFDLSRFFGGLSQQIASRPDLTQWRGGTRLQWEIGEHLEATGGWTRQHRELDGFAVIDSLFLDTVTFSGLDPKNIETLLNATTAMERTDDNYDAGIRVRSLGPVGLHASFSYARQDINVTPDASEIIVPGGQGGEFRRNVRGYEGGADFVQGGFTASVDYRGERADSAVVRTDFLKRDRWRLRGSWSWKKLLRLDGSAELTDATNDDAGFGFESRVRGYEASALFNPEGALHGHVSAGRFIADSSIPVRDPADFSTFDSVQRGDGRSLEAGLSWVQGPFSADLRESRLVNYGSWPVTLDRGGLRARYQLGKNFSIAAEWSLDRYRESPPATDGLANFRANRYGLFLGWMM